MKLFFAKAFVIICGLNTFISASDDLKIKPNSRPFSYVKADNGINTIVFKSKEEIETYLNQVTDQGWLSACKREREQKNCGNMF